MAVCDSELIGKRFEEGEFQLDVKESFYRGKEFSKEEVIEIMKQKILEDATFNIIGKESISAAISTGIISEEAVGRIKGVPFSMTLI